VAVRPRGGHHRLLVKTLYSHAIRVLTCQSCGAPFDATIAGGQIRCTYCGTTNLVSQRDEQADRARAAEARRADMSESERYAQLRNQDRGSENLPESLAPYLGLDGALRPDAVPAAQADWQEARRLIAGGSTAFALAERFFYLTVLLAEHLDDRRLRASLETAAELLTDARHRHVVRCMLARLAAQHGDVQGARAWLETCNPRPLDLTMDTAYRYAAATLAIAQGQTAQVFDLVGHRQGDVPLSDREELACDLLRLHALEVSGRADQSVPHLRSLIARVGADRVHRTLARHRPLSICPRSWADATRADALQRDEQTLNGLVEERSKVATGLHALIAPLGSLPVLVLVVMIPIAVTRCSADADPLMGVYGIVLCPEVCDGCEGPTRTVTEWVQTGPGESSSDGAQYFCTSPQYPVADMSDAQIEDRIRQLAPVELPWTAALGSTFLIVWLALFPLAAFWGASLVWKLAGHAGGLDARIRELAGRLGRAPPEVKRHGGLTRLLLMAILFNAATVGLAALLIAASVYV